MLAGKIQLLHDVLGEPVASKDELLALGVMLSQRNWQNSSSNCATDRNSGIRLMHLRRRSEHLN